MQDKYIIIPEAMLSGLTTAETAVVVGLCRAYDRKRNRVWYGLEKLSGLIGISTRQLTRHLASLASKGVIVQVVKGGKNQGSSEYEIPALRGFYSPKSAPAEQPAPTQAEPQKPAVEPATATPATPPDVVDAFKIFESVFPPATASDRQIICPSTVAQARRVLSAVGGDPAVLRAFLTDYAAALPEGVTPKTYSYIRENDIADWVGSAIGKARRVCATTQRVYTIAAKAASTDEVAKLTEEQAQKIYAYAASVINDGADASALPEIAALEAVLADAQNQWGQK